MPQYSPQCDKTHQRIFETLDIIGLLLSEIKLQNNWHKSGVWVWKAYCRDTGQLIDWELGGRDANTFERLKARLDKWKVMLICTDAYNVYDQAYKPGKHYIGKDQTYRIAQNNSRQRHWFARFRRRSIVVSKSLEMIELTMNLFAAFHVNKTANFSASLIC